MSRTPMPFYVGDVSALARTLRQQLENTEKIPSHLEMLNLLARAGGYRNFQHFRAQNEVHPEASTQAATPAEINHKRIKRILRFFDPSGVLTRWPKKHSERMLCLWVMWSRVAPRTTFSEQEINSVLTEHHAFGDHALLRRYLVSYQFMQRTDDGREYRRIETSPPPEAVEVFRQLRK